MMIRDTPLAAAAASIAVTLIVGCAATTPTLSEGDVESRMRAIMLASFQSAGIVSKDRLNRDATQAECGDYAGKDVPKAIAERIEQRELGYIKFPLDKQFMGDWRRGEALAQSGRGLQFSDDASIARGGNCYACHQISREELSFGTIGPTLLGFGKVRGTSEPIQQYTFGKISNAHAYKACSNMPRFGTMNILSEAQIKDLVALLLDPASPVNK